MSGHQLALEGLSIRTQEVPISIARGEVLDRNRYPLTNTSVKHSVLVFPSQLSPSVDYVDQLAGVTWLSNEDKFNLERIDSHVPPFRLQNGVDSRTAAKINNLGLPGIIAIAESKRYGNYALAAHIVGYINTTDNKGVSGIENMYDDFLRDNQPEYIAALVDASQQLIPGLGYKRVKLDSGASHNNIILTIDKQVQQRVEEIMDRTIAKGSVIILKPSSGEILAMASRPNFDADHLSDYLQNPSAPLLNRTVVAYPPGSVFKLVVAAAALEGKIFKPDDKFFDAGYIDVNNVRFQGWDYEQGPRGKMTFTDAVAYSSNPILIQIALKLGAEKVMSMAKKMGFGQRTKLNFYGEAEGNLPELAELFPADLANLAIGQGVCEATPLQIGQMIATIVNDGVRADPYIVSMITAPDGSIVKKYRQDMFSGQRVISRETAEKLKEMMAAVTRYGTGKAAYVENDGSGGKTGSAETGRIDSAGKSISHAWFAGYTPLAHPQYVIVVFIEEGMSGGNVAAPVFKEIASELMKLNP
ncbi:peptidoglycan D,D-transpeptidase FtsI family protein [Methylomusa anaerophila]|nr:penicillin-binding protein 2 [Methylomusa anaerophila]